jgi:hypothetical protein
MVNESDKVLVYRSSNEATYRQQSINTETGEKIGEPRDPKKINILADGGNGILSLSYTPMGKTPKKMSDGTIVLAFYNADRVPANNDYDDVEASGELTISPDKQWQEPTGTIVPGQEYKGGYALKSRSSVITHEIMEIIRRILDQCGYMDAHSDASVTESTLNKGDSRKSRHPGSGN